jgi:uncharacterized membrane protein
MTGDNWGRIAFSVAVAGLAIGVLMHRMGQSRPATWAVAATCALLITLPVVNVLRVLAEEARRRDWLFVGIATGVLVLVVLRVAISL